MNLRSVVKSMLPIGLYEMIISGVTRISPTLASEIVFYGSFGKRMNLQNPKDINEKLMWLKLHVYADNPLVIKCADKYTVRTYVEECGCQDVLNELYGVYDSPEEINWNTLPEKCVIKTTNGCGTNLIITDIASLDKEAASRQLRKWLNSRIGLGSAETHYSKMRPRIICEKYIETESGLLPTDYKFFCTYGKLMVILACTDRAGAIKKYFFDRSWQRMRIDSGNHPDDEAPVRPADLEKMIECAARLSAKFPFVRVDFYQGQQGPIFGEMTFTPAGNRMKSMNQEGRNMLGEMLDIRELMARDTVANA